MFGLFERKPIETVEEARRRAKRRLPKPIYTSLVAGNERGVTLDQNVSAFDEVGFVPRVGADIARTRDMSASFMGQDISLPVVMSPAAAVAIHPGGEVAVARAAAKHDTAIGQSNFAASAFEDVAAANPKSFFQLYWTGTREQIQQRIERMRRAGAKGLILTLDATMTQPRDWGSPAIPADMGLATMMRYAPMGAANPRWTLDFLRNGGLPDMRVPNLQKPGKQPPTMMEGQMEWASFKMPTWDDVAWLAEVWGGPFMVKGILHPDDARRAVDSGATTIGVSNHGGNNLDSTVSPLRFLPSVVEAVGAQAEITFDSGVRRGSDAVKAIALGANSVLVARSWFFGLAAGGENGVSEVLDAYKVSIDRTLIGLGKNSLNELSREDLTMSPDFFLDNFDPLPMRGQ